MTDGLMIGPAKKKPGPPKGTRPSGRQKGTPNKATASIRDIARQYTDKAIKALVDVLSDKNEPAAARVGAANALLDRGYGKPTQSIDLDTSVGLAVTIIERRIVDPGN